MRINLPTFLKLLFMLSVTTGSTLALVHRPGMASSPPVLTGGASQSETAPIFTFGDLADSVLLADSLADFESSEPKLHAKVRAAALALRGLEKTTDAIAFSDQLKATRPEALKEIPADLGKSMRDMECIKAIFTHELQVALVDAEVDSMKIVSLQKPLLGYQQNQLRQIYDRSRNRLFRYEQRYGEKAPKLNFLEAGVSQALQGLYPFGANAQGPGPLEPVARFGTTWFLAYHEKVNDIPRTFTLSALWEFGFRWYNYSLPIARPTLFEMLQPNSIAMGYAMAPAERNWMFLINDEGYDSGFFVDVEAFKIAVTFGKYNRVFFGRQFQIVPHLF